MTYLGVSLVETCKRLMAPPPLHVLDAVQDAEASLRVW